MLRQSMGCALTSLLTLAVFSNGRPAAAELRDNAQRQGQEAGALVDEALQREWYGLEDERDQLLRKALELDPNYAKARWHSGFVRLGDQWVHVSEAPQRFSRDASLKKYYQTRSKAQDTVAGNLWLANWCRQRDLPLLEQAHLTRITRLAPDHAEAHQRLGHFRVQDEWVETGAFWQGWANAARTAASVREYEDDIKSLVKAVQRPQASARVLEAELRLRLQDVSAVPALETCLAYQSPEAAQLAVTLLSGIAEHPASEALARLAALAPWPEVRRQGARALQVRPLHDYVPLLLNEISAPIESRIQAVQRGGDMLVRHVMSREEQGHTHVEVFDAAVLRRGVAVGANNASPGPNAANDAGEATGNANGSQGASSGAGPVPREVMEAAMQRMLIGQAVWLENQRMLQNQWIATVNRRIAEALTVATGKIFDTPQQWWDWWDQENEVTGNKPTTVNYTARQEEYASPTGVAGSVGGATVRHECFVAGTLVWTSRGPEAIETLRVGDLVLSQDPESGQLAYTPVTTTTQRAPEMLVRVHTAAGVLEGSGGHPMWVVGRGWVKLRDLESGMLLHGVEGAVPVSQVEAGSFAATYNLIVAGAPTYCVGPEKLLCHDNTPRRPTSAVVPGATSAR